ncbi:putative MFS alpha-glucoside transporter [Aspergillus brunneoviolaceus CBS 621.78]|uniref:MFS alpha-glucoside transporter n=1 Tax=Aspergillus brunneoviolaceus CBS 621.78 TaxID=1450534 RepID=A0ACD1GLV4_9EURO|nr:MFS alpha-glucoside transporter [Aspergillus brunneoviolaceus CBS 621.78]RAH50170.1 MFS alpha-glucoside transporter [Aspergillus brunneoviolaceus CBS 621.78]
MKDEKNEKDEIVIQAIPTASLQDAESSQEFLAAEHALTFWPALRQHWPTVAWALFMNLATILKGIVYQDGGVVKGIVGLDVFKQNYGYEHEGRYILAARWLSAFNYANLLGAIVGALFAGLAYDRFGPRIVLTGCSCLSIGFIFVQFFSQTPAQLFVGELINGCVIAFYPICASAYVGEVTPLPLRGFAATMTNLAFSIGSLIASGILKGTTSLASDWSYRIPIATQWALPCIMLALVPFCPDPPYWLCRQGRPEAAAASLRRLTVRGGAIGPRLAHIQETLRLEASFQQPTTARSLECLQGPNRRRLLICVMAYSMQAFTGNVFFINYAVHFMETAGLNASHAFSMNLGLSALGLLGTILSWPLLAYVGRRTMYMTGCSALALTQLLIGVLDVVPRRTGTIWAQCALMLACTLVYDVSLGPFCYVLLAEVSSMRLRGVTIGLATVSCFVWSVVFAVAIPYAMDADEGDWGGKLAFLFAGTSLVCAAMCFWWLPETQGRTFEELDAMFEQGVRSRRFRRCVVVIGEEGRGAVVAMREEGGGRRGGGY